MAMKVISTPLAPAAVGPYSQAIVSGKLVYTAGQIALHPTRGQLVGDNVAEQTRQVFANLASILQEAGSSLEKVIKTTVFLVNIDNFGEMNAEYAKYFLSHRPARTTVAVSGLPKGALVEIEAVAALDR